MRIINTPNSEVSDTCWLDAGAGPVVDCGRGRIRYRLRLPNCIYKSHNQHKYITIQGGENDAP